MTKGTLLIALLTLGFFGAATISGTQDASAKRAPAKLIKKVNVKNGPVHFDEKGYGAYVFSSTDLTKHAHYAGTFDAIYSTFTRTTTAKIKKTNGKTYDYTYVKSSDGFINGWVWSGYLITGKNNKHEWDKKAALASVKKLPSDIKLKKNSVKASDNISGRDYRQTYAKMTNGHKLYWLSTRPDRAVEVMPKLYTLHESFTNNTKHWIAYYIICPDIDQWHLSGFRDLLDYYQDSDGGFNSVIYTGGGGDHTMMSKSKKIILVDQNEAIHDEGWGCFSPVSHYAK